jgi:hypothetical protein
MNWFRCKRGREIDVLRIEIALIKFFIRKNIVATIQDLRDDLSAVQTTTDAVATGVKDMITMISGLKTQVAAGKGVSQAEIDALDLQAKNTLAVLTQVHNSETATLAPEAPTPAAPDAPAPADGSDTGSGTTE